MSSWIADGKIYRFPPERMEQKKNYSSAAAKYSDLSYFLQNSGQPRLQLFTIGHPT